MGPITRRTIITLAFAAAFLVPPLAGMARGSVTEAQSPTKGCWELVTNTNAATMLPICSSTTNW